MLETTDIYLIVVRYRIRNDASDNDRIKDALSARAYEVNRLQYEKCAPMANNQGVITYINSCNCRI
jgi:hypothetical protein